MEMILLNDIDKTNKSFEDIKHIEEMVLNFGMLESLCLFYNTQTGKTLKK